MQGAIHLEDHEQSTIDVTKAAMKIVRLDKSMTAQTNKARRYPAA